MFKRLLPHLCIITSLIIMVLWVIDRINGAMNFLGRDIFKIPLFIFCILVIYESIMLIVYQRRH